MGNQHTGAPVLKGGLLQRYQRGPRVRQHRHGPGAARSRSELLGNASEALGAARSRFGGVRGSSGPLGAARTRFGTARGRSEPLGGARGRSGQLGASSAARPGPAPLRSSPLLSVPLRSSPLRSFVLLAVRSTPRAAPLSGDAALLPARRAGGDAPASLFGFIPAPQGLTSVLRVWLRWSLPKKLGDDQQCRSILGAGSHCGSGRSGFICLLLLHQN